MEDREKEQEGRAFIAAVGESTNALDAFKAVRLL